MTRRKRKFDRKSNEYSQHSRKSVNHQNVNRSWTEGEPQPKKQKIDNAEKSTECISIHQKELDLSDFRFKRMLDSNNWKKEIILEGTFEGYQSPAIVILEKKISNQWPLLKMEFFDSKIFTKQISINDVYGDYNCFPKNDFNGWKMRIIHPASQTHLDKYAKTAKKTYLINETYETYEKITRPYIESEALPTQWINGILSGKAEKKHIIYSNDDDESGFVMLPNMKWDGSLEKLNLLIVSRQKIKSLRDLNETHLPLLKNIRDVGTSIMKEKYDLPPSQFKMSLHYQPTYYHFHVLVSTSMFQSQGEHLLSNVINNIELVSNYYQRAELSFFLKQSHPLCKKYQDNGIIIAHED